MGFQTRYDTRASSVYQKAGWYLAEMISHLEDTTKEKDTSEETEL